ncbi:MAG: PilZ domain-containing protein [Candidatus Baltobacteraceae bacterium]
MSWIPKKTSPGSTPVSVAVATNAAAAPAKTFGHSLEMPIVMSVRRLPAPVYGTLMEITGTAARVRSLILMDRGAEIEFDLGIGSGAPLTLCGRVQNRRNASSGARFEYHVTFDMTAEAQLDTLTRHVRELERRAAASRSIQHAIDSLPTTDRNRRGSYRAMTAFPVLFRREDDPNFWEGRVGDISGTGVRMNCSCVIAIGTMLELRLSLPNNVLEVYPEETAAIDLHGSAPRRIGRPDMRRPFDEMSLRARVVTRFAPTRDREVYGAAFFEIDGYQREEIARFTHALQLSRIRGGLSG